jgi:adenylate cyclase
MSKEKLLKRALAAYAGEHVLQRVLDQGEDALKLGGQVDTLTLYFQDIASSTILSKELGPEKVVRFLHEYLTVMTETIERHNGVIVQFMGDAIMALWGSKGEPDHADKACACAVAAVYQADFLSQRFYSGVQLSMGK